MEGGIYSIACHINGRVYIGSTISFEKRFKSHRFHLRRGDHRNSHLQRAWLKYGEVGFSFNIVEEVAGVDQLLVREQFWLDNTRNKFNVLPLAGATRGVKRSEETKARMSAASKGQVPTAECIAAGRKARMGVKLSDETKLKMSKAHLGRKHGPMSAEHKAAISAAQIGVVRVFTEQHREALRKSSTGRVMSAEAKAKISAGNKGLTRVFTEQHRAGIAAAWRGRKQHEVSE